jgi:hypothetical protein
MIIVRVELHSAITGKVTELARMMIHNVGRAPHRPEGWWRYGVLVFRGRDRATLDRAEALNVTTREAVVPEHASDRVHVWHLVSKALEKAGYGYNQRERDKRLGEEHVGPEGDAVLSDKEPRQD